MKPRTKRLLGLLMLGLVVACLFVLAIPHEIHHDQPGADCTLCFANATEAPEPIQVARAADRLAHLDDAFPRVVFQEWDWAASAPRAPPASV